MNPVRTLAAAWLARSFRPFEFTDEADPSPPFAGARNLGLYVHVPFCRSLCGFCPYCRVRYDEALCARYLDALEGEIEAVGGGDDPEDSLEALGYAIKSKWTRGGDKRRHVIVLWSDDVPHDLGFGRAAPNYPSRMAKSFDELTEWWGATGLGGVMNPNDKRLLIYAPNKGYWNDIMGIWDNTLLFPSEAGKGLEETTYSAILDAIANSI